MDAINQTTSQSNFLTVIDRYETTQVEGTVVRPVESKMIFRTERKVPKVGPLAREIEASSVVKLANDDSVWTSRHSLYPRLIMIAENYQTSTDWCYVGGPWRQ